jgi:hypothetical protein
MDAENYRQPKSLTVITAEWYLPGQRFNARAMKSYGVIHRCICAPNMLLTVRCGAV